ncbi:group II intron reverse transcriptase/maturase [Streptomonospora salina]|uniref:RNA-directed DNA polymerase n=1 Tax=Streptomonospora salina TaxID=104205 RepID=A0A841EGL1_9ACTN|nr:group II intron reverse transcriptase/maturase [Streptomonospora salina]MBB5999988.1 RNA-directed DNA polymerase [Streptomonospora salina]
MSGATLVNTGVPFDAATAASRVLGIQSKLHDRAAADPGRRFDDLFNLVADPAFLLQAWRRVRANTGARTAGVDGWTAYEIENTGDGLAGFLARIRADVKARVFVPLPVAERRIPKSGGKVRRLGIPTIRDRVVQASLKLVLEPIFETGFSSSSYGFRPGRRAQDAIEDVIHHARVGYEWVFETDIAACFDEISHPVLMDRVRARVGDKKVLALVKAFLHAGVLTGEGDLRNTPSGTPQGGILSPLLANIALSAIDEHFDAQWDRHGGNTGRRRHRRRGGATYRLVRYADDLVVLVHGTVGHAHALRGEVADVAARLGLRLAADKTRTVHIDDGFDFLGFRIQRHTQWGTDRRRVYSYPSVKAAKAVRAKVKEMTGRQTMNMDPAVVFTRLGQILRGWTNYYRHGASKIAFSELDHYVWHRVWKWLRRRHRRRHWRWIVRTYGSPRDRWGYAADGVDLFRPAAVPIQRYLYRGNAIPLPWSRQSENS